MYKARINLLAWIGVSALALLSPPAADANWPSSPLSPVVLRQGVLPGSVVLSGLAPDGTGGAFATWWDSRSGDYDIYAQHILATGVVDPAWPRDGVAVCVAPGTQDFSDIVADGAGGAFVVWADQPSAGAWLIRAQRVSGNGTLSWASGGVPISPPTFTMGTQTFTAHGTFAHVFSDAAGGAVIAWEERDSYNSYVADISPSGQLQWTTPACEYLSGRVGNNFASDGAGGVLISWEDSRNRGRWVNYGYDAYAQHISSSGVAQWAKDGVQVSLLGAVFGPLIAPDGAGGAVVSWNFGATNPGGNTASPGVYAQRLSAGGSPLWALGGDSLAGANSSVKAIARTSGENTSLTWSNWSTTTGGIVGYATQLLSPSGTPHLPGGGVIFTSSAAYKLTDWRGVIPDNSAGVIFPLIYSPPGVTPASYTVYAQRVSSDGSLAWAPDGVQVGAPASGSPVVLGVTDGAGGAIVAYAGVGLCAQRIQSSGQLGGGTTDVSRQTAPSLELELLSPNPIVSGPMAVRFTLPSSAAASMALLDIAGRSVLTRELSDEAPGAHTITMAIDSRLSPGLFFLRLWQGASIRVVRVTVLR